MDKGIFGGRIAAIRKGSKFEKETDIKNTFRKNGYIVSDSDEIFLGSASVGYVFDHAKIYKYIKTKENIDHEKINSKKYTPDQVFYNKKNNTYYVIEKKYQEKAGSTDEKLQTCDFKKRRFTALLGANGARVEYIYILNDFFKDKRYKDVFEYMEEKGVFYFFNEIPISFMIQ